MTLENLGYNPDFEKNRQAQKLGSFEIARVISEHKERYFVKTLDREYEAEVIGNLRYTAQKRSDFPAVGDWVAISEYDEDKVLIHSVLPRQSLIERQAVGKQGEKQIIASNLDYAFIVQSVDRDFNLNRIERYLTICNTAKVSPIIILNKIDLIEEDKLQDLITKVQKRVNEVPILPISNESLKGMDKLKEYIHKGKTYCLLGSSGVGKSSLLNNLLGEELMKTRSISDSSNKGRHVTSHRELVVLEDGGIVIDNPGMREVGVIDSAEGMEVTFEAITDLAKDCKFKDCKHISEIGCAVIAAVENGDIDQSSYSNFLKLEREKEHFEASIAEKRQKDKDFGKMIKRFKNIKQSKG